MKNAFPEHQQWLNDILAVPMPADRKSIEVDGESFSFQKNILRADSIYSSDQDQTREIFGFKWKKRDTFESDASLKRMKAWLVERYGDIPNVSWWSEYGQNPVVLDAGCGAGMSGIELFGEIIPNLHYLCVDVSEAIDVAYSRFQERHLPAAYIQTSLMNIPVKKRSVDVIFSEGVLHHTDSTETAIYTLSELLKPGGRFLFYVYKKKGPIREYTDDYIREKITDMAPDTAWEEMESLTEFGKMLGELDIDITVPKDINLLEIPKGKISLQRFFYWHIFKAFYHPDLSIDEMNHINFDWYAPRNAHRQSPGEVTQWCANAGLEIERKVIEDAGITIIARKNS